MKPKDHLHNISENTPQNMRVFSKTYETIDNLANKISRIEAAAFGITDKEMLEQLNKINAEHVSEQIIDLINYAIENYRKSGRR